MIAGSVGTRLRRFAAIGVKALSIASDPVLGPLTGPRILIYHQIGANLGRQMEVATASFTRQLEWMAAHGEIVSLEDAIARRHEAGAENLFALTFDDGFADVYENAFPVLRSRGVPFTLYLTTGPIESGEPLDPNFPTARPFTWDQVNEMVDSGLATLGAHTHTHPDLRSATSSQIESELDTSNEMIERRTGRRPLHFTYPWGWWSDLADRLVRDRYVTATVGDGGSIVDSSLHDLPRRPVQRSDGVQLFARRMKGGFRLEDKVRRSLQRYEGP